MEVKRDGRLVRNLFPNAAPTAGSGTGLTGGSLLGWPAALLGWCRRGPGRFLGLGGGRLRCRFRWLRWRIGGPEMTIAGRALPELLGRPRVFGSGVLQLHLGAASLATNTDIGVVHVEILVSRPGGAQHDSRAGHPVWAALLLGHTCPMCSLVAPCQPGAAPRTPAARRQDGTPVSRPGGSQHDSRAGHPVWTALLLGGRVSD